MRHSRDQLRVDVVQVKDDYFYKQYYSFEHAVAGRQRESRQKCDPGKKPFEIREVTSAYHKHSHTSILRVLPFGEQRTEGKRQPEVRLPPSLS